MITFKQIEKYDYQLNCGTKPPLTVSLLRNNAVSNKFIFIVLSIEAMSKLIGEVFDEHIFNLVNDYQKCSTEDDRYDILIRNVEETFRFSDFFIEENDVDYTGFVDESQRTNGSIFFDIYDIKKIAKLSQALKIYSLVLNTDFGVAHEKVQNIYHQFIILLRAEHLPSKLLQFTKSIAISENKYMHFEEEDLNNIIFEAFNHITYKGLIPIDYKTNPIPFLGGIVKQYVKYGRKYKSKYDFADDDLSRKESTEKKLADKVTLKRLYDIALLQLSDIHKYHQKNTPEIIEKIKYTSPFWDAILTHVFSKSTGISLKRLRKIYPQQAALLSFYSAIRLNRIFDPKYKNLFELAFLFPTNEPKYGNYRLKNVSQFINATIQFRMMDLSHIGGSRIFIVKLIEDILGKIKSAPFCNVSTGEFIGNIQTDDIETQLIDYILRYFTYGFEEEFEKFKNVIIEDLNFITAGKRNKNVR